MERIRQLYTTREERLLPVPWCEDFSFHLNDIFTRLRIVNKEKTRGTLAREITNMTAIFQTQHDESCPEGCLGKKDERCRGRKPRTVLIEGDPGMGKTTYCQKLAYDWANRQEEWDESFPEIDLLLLLRCHDIKSNIWEAIEEQILPEDIDEESKENFFKFIRENQPKVLLMLDGLDEADPSKLPMYIKIAESRELPKCHIVFTSRHEAGMKFRRLSDNLWEIVGFTSKDAESFIFKYFKNVPRLADKLIRKLSNWSWSEYRYLREITRNPLNTALLCVLCEDFEGDLPTNRTQLYIEIVLCVLRRYEKKKGFSSNHEDLIKVYEEELIHLGLLALTSLHKGELYIEETKCGSNSTVLTKFGFLSVQAAGGRRKPCLRCGFLHKSFQEFFAGFYLASKILSGEIDLDTVVTDGRYLNELKQVFLFMSGIVVSKCEETAVCLVKHIASKRFAVNSEDEFNSNVKFAFDCIQECKSYKENLKSRLMCTFGSHLPLETLKWDGGPYSPHTEFFIESLVANTTLTSLLLSGKDIGHSVAVSLCKVLSSNTTLSHLNLTSNEIGDSGADSLSKALTVNTTLTHLKLFRNKIGCSGASSFSKALLVNTTLTHLELIRNEIGDVGVASLGKTLIVNTALINLDLSGNRIGNSGVAFLSDGLRVNITLTHLNLSRNKIGDSGADFLFKALTVNTTLTHLTLIMNKIAGSGDCSLSQALSVNTTLTHLDLSRNVIDGDAACTCFPTEALTVNTTLTRLNLSRNRIGDFGTCSLSKALTVNTTLTDLVLTGNGVGDSGAGYLSNALTVNSTLAHLDLSMNEIGDSGAGSLSNALTANTTLTHLVLTSINIADSGAGSLSEALTVNTTLTHLNLSENKIADSGAGSLSNALTVNTTLTHLNLSVSKIADSGAGSLSEALTVNTTLTHLNLSENKIADSGAGSLSNALTVNTTLTHLNLSMNEIGDYGTSLLAEALKGNTALAYLNLSRNRFFVSGYVSFRDAKKVNTTCRVELKS